MVSIICCNDLFASAYSSGDFEVSSTILVLPETYLEANLSNFCGQDLSKFARVIFNQNAYYSFGGFSSTLEEQLATFYDSSNVLQVLSVSEDTHDFLTVNLNLADSKVSRIVNAVENIFRPASNPSNTIHWMPRKNPQEAQAVLLSIKRSCLSHTNGWTGSPLVSLSHDSVASHLNKAKIFLSFGHPEGFGLPIAEAMASGCWVIGYSGGGGRELFRFGASDEISFGDWTSFSQSVNRALTLFSKNPREMNIRLERQSLAVRTLYSQTQERASIQSAWSRIFTNFKLFSQNL